MNSNRKRAMIQRRISKKIEVVDTLNFFNLLTTPQLLSKTEELQPDFRERIFPPTETLSMFLSQAMNADRSCQNIVNAMGVQRLMHGLQPHSTGTSSYCKARQRLSMSMVSELVRCTGQLTQEALPSQWCWQGRSVKLVDGTTVTMPDTEANQNAYPQQAGQKPGLGFPICRILAVFCLASGSILNAAMGPYKGKGADEQTLLRGLLDSLNQKDLLLGDALFASYFLLAELQARDIDAVFEQHGARKKSTDFRQGKRLGTKDHLITYTKPKKKPDWMTEDMYQAAPATVTIRELKVGDKILVTTLLSPKEASKKALQDLYKDRWQVELNLRHIKTTLGMETLSCKSPDMVLKEMWVYFLAYNLIRLVMAQSAVLADLLPRQISFKHTLQLWQAYRQQQGIGNQINLSSLCLLIAENCVGNRPGRVEPRAVKRRPKPYPLLMKERELAREDIKKHGHPKKQK